MAGRLTLLESWLREIRENKVEVFLVHDIQDNETTEELRRLVLDQNNPNVYFSEGKFGTAGLARNSALNSINGEWVTFWDSDDLPNLKNVLKAIDNSYDVIIGEFQVIYYDGKIRTYQHRENFKKSITAMSFQPGLWRTLFRKKVITNIKFPSFQLAEDQDFLAQINWDVIKVKFDPSNFYTYNAGHDFQTTAHGKSRSSILDSIYYLLKLLKSDIGSELFIRNLATRQYLTLIKDSNLKMRMKATLAFLNFFRTPKGAYRQVISIFALFSFLARPN
jgi:glycosyltransferase involved in cell wall biosynthesis